MSLRRGEATPDGEPGYSPFGLPGQHVGELAYILKSSISAPGESLPYPSDHAPRWTDSDRLVFGRLLDLEAGVPSLAHEVRGEYAEERFPVLRRLRGNLPYGPGEWRWLITQRQYAWHVTPDQAYELVLRGGSFPYEEQILRNWTGHIAATALIHQWTTWRRGLEPYTDPAFHEDIKEALDELSHELLPNGPRPYAGP
jgi:hypothetical protein